jgi:hypothetical protein
LHAVIPRGGTATAHASSATVFGAAHYEIASPFPTAMMVATATATAVVAGSPTTVVAASPTSAALRNENVAATTAVVAASTTAPEPTATTTAFHFGNGWRCDPNQPESESNTHHHRCFHRSHHSTSVQGLLLEGSRADPCWEHLFRTATLAQETGG